MPTVEKSTFDKKHLAGIRGIITKGVKRVTPSDIKRLRKHVEESMRLEATLKRAIDEYDKTKSQMDRIRRSNTFKRLTTMTKKGYKNIVEEMDALKTLDKAHKERRAHLEYIRSTRGMATTFLKDYDRSMK